MFIASDFSVIVMKEYESDKGVSYLSEAQSGIGIYKKDRQRANRHVFQRWAFQKSCRGDNNGMTIVDFKRLKPNTASLYNLHCHHTGTSPSYDVAEGRHGHLFQQTYFQLCNCNREIVSVVTALSTHLLAFASTTYRSLPNNLFSFWTCVAHARIRFNRMIRQQMTIRFFRL